MTDQTNKSSGFFDSKKLKGAIGGTSGIMGVAWMMSQGLNIQAGIILALLAAGIVALQIIGQTIVDILKVRIGQLVPSIPLTIDEEEVEISKEDTPESIPGSGN